MSVTDTGRWISRGGHMEYIHDDDDDYVRLRPPPREEAAPAAPPPVRSDDDDYRPVPRRRQTVGGWTADRQRAFLAALAQTGSVVQAAGIAGISARSAYRLRAHPDGGAFAAAWANAVMSATHSLLATAFERATDGAPRRVWRGGRIVEERGPASDRMLMYLLGRLLPGLLGGGGADAVLRGRQIQGFQALLAPALDALVDVDLEAEAFDPEDA